MRRPLVLAAVLFLLWAPGAYAWTWPVQGPVLLGFVFDPSHPYGGGQHRGIDIGAATGTPVGAPTSGTVSFAGTVPTSGKSVTIATADGYSVTLTHLGSIEVAKGAAVGEGSEVGTVGPSGTPELDVPYLYMGVRVTANAQGYLDPLSFLPALPPPVASSPAPPPATEPSTVGDVGGSVEPPPATTTPDPAPPPPDTTTTPAEVPPPDATAAPPDATPEATSTPTSGEGDVPAPADPPPPADAPPPDTGSDAPAPSPAGDAPDATPEATSTPTSGPGDVPAPADPPPPADAPPPDTGSDAPAPPPAGDAGATDSTPAPTPAPAPAPSPPTHRAGTPKDPPSQPHVAPAPKPPHATVLNPDPGFDPTADDAQPESVVGDAPASPTALEPVAVAAVADDAFRVHATVPAVTAAAAVQLLQQPLAPAVPSVQAPRLRAVPLAVRRAPRRVPVVVPARRPHPAVRLPAATSPVVVRAHRGRTRWPLYLLSALACAAGVGGVRMISSSSKTSEGAHPVAVAEDPRRGRVALRERPAAPGPCRRPRGALRHLRALPPAEGQRRPHGERDGRARHAGDGLGRSRGRVAS